MNCNVLTEPWDLRWSVERHVRWATNSNKTILKWNPLWVCTFKRHTYMIWRMFYPPSRIEDLNSEENLTRMLLKIIGSPICLTVRLTQESSTQCFSSIKQALLLVPTDFLHTFTLSKAFVPAGVSFKAWSTQHIKSFKISIYINIFIKRLVQLIM